MQLVSITTDGTVTVQMSAQDAAAVRDDLGAIWANKVSQPGDKLHSLLEHATSDTDRAAASTQPVNDGLDKLFNRLGPPTANGTEK